MKEALLLEESNEALQQLRFYFVGFLDDVTPGDGNEQLAEFLTSEGVLR